MTDIQNEKIPSPEENKEKDSAQKASYPYVPAFTGASENYRMMADNKDASVPYVTVSGKRDGAPARSLSDDMDDAPPVKTYQKVAVRIGDGTKAEEDIIRVPKPAPAEVTLPPRTVEDEKKDIQKLIEPQTADTPEEEKPLPFHEPEPGYVLPDPTFLPTQISPEEKEVAEAQPAKKMPEYSLADATRFKNRFLDTLMSMRLRLFAVIALAAVLLTGAALLAAGVDIPDRFGLPETFYWLPIADLECSLLLSLLVLPEVVSALRDAFKKRVTPALLFPVLALANMAYDAVLSAGYFKYRPLFGAAFAAVTLVLLLSRYLTVKATFAAFRVTSLAREKTVLCHQKTATLERETLALDGVIDEYSSATATTVKTPFVSDFFETAGKTVGLNLRSAVCVTVSVLWAVLGASAVLTVTGSVPTFFTCLLISLLATPALALGITAAPLYHLSRHYEKAGGALLGADSAKTYADVDVVTYSDREVFGKDGISIKQVLLFGDATYSEVFTDTAALFTAVGGVLSTLFSAALDETVSEAGDVVVENDGVRGEVYGKRTFVGTAEYMKQNGIQVPADAKKDNAPQTRMLYLASGGTVRAGFTLSFAFCAAFHKECKIMQNAGMKALVYLSVPGVDNAFLATLAGADNLVYLMKVFSLRFNPVPTVPACSAGVVSVGGKGVAVSLIASAKRFIKTVKTSSAVVWALSLAAPAVALSLTLTASATALVPVCLTAWQLLGTCLAFFLTKKKSI